MTVEDVPDIILERYRLNELTPSEAVALGERLVRDAALRERLAALDRSDAALQSQVEDIALRLVGRRQDRPRRVLWSISAVAALAGMTIALAVRTQLPAVGTPSAEDRIKGATGGAAISLYRRTPDGSERLADGAVARKGDLIRVAYRAAGYTYGVILSIDGRGSVTVHLPPTGVYSAPLEAGPSVLLDQAYELDDAPGWERFYFVAGDSAFDVASVMQAAREVAKARMPSPPSRLGLPARFGQSGFTLQKDSSKP